MRRIDHMELDLPIETETTLSTGSLLHAEVIARFAKQDRERMAVLTRLCAPCPCGSELHDNRLQQGMCARCYRSKCRHLKYLAAARAKVNR